MVIREQVVVAYEDRSHDEILKIVEKLISGGNRIVSITPTFRSEYNHFNSSYLIVYEKPYDS